MILYVKKNQDFIEYEQATKQYDEWVEKLLNESFAVWQDYKKDEFFYQYLSFDDWLETDK